MPTAAKCPLGFEGELPAGHPAVPGFVKGAFASADASSSETSSTITYAWLAFDALLLLVVALSLIWHNRPVGVAARPELPSPKPTYPLIGNLLLMLENLHLKKQGVGEGLLHQMVEWQRELGTGGKPFTFTLPGPTFGGRATVINRPEYIQWAQKTNFENYEKGKPFRRNFNDVLSEHGIFAADGEVWRKQRKMASNIFSVSNFRTHVQKTVHADLDKLEALLRNVSASGAKVNLPDVFFRFTLDTFGEMAFSASLECLPTDAAGLEKEVEFAKAFDFAQQVANERFLDPFWQISELFSKQGRDMRASIKVLRSTCFAIIDKRFAAIASGEGGAATSSKGGKDLLQLFLELGLSREDLLPVVLNFIIAGRDTTAQALSWAFTELHRHPDVVKKMREEVDRVLGRRKMEYDDLKSMIYTQAVFLEVLRLHPSVPKNLKVAVKDDVIRPYAQDFDRTSGGDGEKSEKVEILPEDRLPDIRIQKGTTVIWSDWVMARMPEIWGPDCEDFKPERFLKENGTALRTYSPYKFHAFNAGPRICLGQSLATYEGCAVLALMVSGFDTILNDAALKEDPPIYAESLTLPIANPYSAQFRVRTP